LADCFPDFQREIDFGREILKILLLIFFIIEDGKLIFALIVIFLDLAFDSA